MGNWKSFPNILTQASTSWHMLACASAWRQMDETLVTDVAVRFAEGERDVFCPHNLMVKHKMMPVLETISWRHAETAYARQCPAARSKDRLSYHFVSVLFSLYVLKLTARSIFASGDLNLCLEELEILMYELFRRTGWRFRIVAGFVVTVCISPITFGQDADLLIPPDEAIIDTEEKAFEQYASLAQLAVAWRNQDSEALTDLALQFLEGERVLLRSHKKMKSAEVLDIAIRVASERNDKVSLERLAKALDRTGDKDRVALVNMAISTAGAARAEHPELKEGSPEVVAEIDAFVQAIQSARVAGSKTQIASLKTALGELTVSDTQRSALSRMIEESQDALDVGETTLGAIQELDQMNGIIRSAEEIKDPEGMPFRLPNYDGAVPIEAQLSAYAEALQNWKNPDEAPMDPAKQAGPLADLMGASRGAFWTDWASPTTQKSEWYAYNAYGRGSIYQYTNNPGAWLNNNCGQAAAATMLTFHRVQAKYALNSKGGTDLQDTLDKVFPPDLRADNLFGFRINCGTSPNRVMSACSNYGLNCWLMSGHEEKLRYWVSWGYPCIVITNVNKLGWKNKGKSMDGLHYQVVYAYSEGKNKQSETDDYYWLTNNNGSPKVRRDIFKSAWVVLPFNDFILTQPKPGMQKFPEP